MSFEFKFDWAWFEPRLKLIGRLADEDEDDGEMFVLEIGGGGGGGGWGGGRFEIVCGFGCLLLLFEGLWALNEAVDETDDEDEVDEEDEPNFLHMFLTELWNMNEPKPSPPPPTLPLPLLPAEPEQLERWLLRL